jgi:hypothetical protein
MPDLIPVLIFLMIVLFAILMTAPAPTARVAPTGAKMRDGFSTKITLAVDTNIEFWEKEVTPPGIEGGEPINQGDMYNVAWELKIPQALKDMTEMAVTANYDPLCITSAAAAVNVMTTVTVKFPAGDTLAFYGYLRSFKPNPIKKGEQPTAAIVIVPTNFDPTAGAEAGPVYTAAGS